eukprot:122536-Heterocapsa_arctica.AAC.1
MHLPFGIPSWDASALLRVSARRSPAIELSSTASLSRVSALAGRLSHRSLRPLLWGPVVRGPPP